MKRAIVFPGLAKLTYGDLATFIERSHHAKQRFEEASEILGVSLLEMFRGDKEVYNEISQCVFITNTVALLDLIRDHMDLDDMDYCVGGSYGGMIAAVFTGSLTFEQAVQVTYQSAKVEKEFVRKMDATYGTHFIYRYPTHRLNQLMHTLRGRGHWIEISAYISDKLTAVCARMDTIQMIKEMVRKGRGMSLQTIDRLIHSSKLTQLKEEVSGLYDRISFQSLNTPIISDVNGEVLYQSDGLKEMLLVGIHHPIRWDLTVARMKKLRIKEVHVVGAIDVLGPVMKEHFDTNMLHPGEVLKWV